MKKSLQLYLLEHSYDKAGDIKSSFLSTPSMPVTTMALQGGIPEHFAEPFKCFHFHFPQLFHFQEQENQENDYSRFGSNRFKRGQC